MKKTISFFSFFILIFGLILIIGGCSESSEPSNSEQDIVIGALLPMTGTGSSPGEATFAALQIAETNINQQLTDIGQKRRLTVIYEDTKTDTAVALEQLKKLATMGIRFVVGPYSSAEVSALKDYADKNGIILVSPSSVAISLSIKNDNIYRFVTNDNSQAEALTAMLVSDTIKAIVPIIRDDVWGNDLFNSLSQKFNAGGGKVYPAIKYDPKTTDFSTKIIDLVNYATQAASEYPEKNVGIYMASFEEGTSILNGFSAVNGLMNVKWYGSSAYANNKTLLNDNIAMSVAIAHKLQCPIFGLDDAAKDKWQPFVDYLTTQLGRTPEVYALTAYDALCVIASSYMKFNVSNPDFTHLKSLFIDEANNYYGLTGRTTLNDAGDRAYADYDFWSLTNSPVSQWIRSATYQTSTGTLRRY